MIHRVSEHSLHCSERMTLHKSSRAKPLSLNDRRELIVDAIIPPLSHMVARFRLVQKRIDTVGRMLRENAVGLRGMQP